MTTDTENTIATKEPTVRVNLNLDAEDHKRLRMFCITNNQTIQQSLSVVVKNWLKEIFK